MNGQLALPSVPLKHQTEANGFEMGVMSDGTPYLTASGLAYICGTARSNIITLVNDWQNQRLHPRGRIISQIIERNGGNPSKDLHIPIKVRGKTHHAVPHDICMAVLEYYAFESRSEADVARDNFRNLASQSLKEFIYKRTGYKGTGALPRHLERYTKNRAKIPYTHFSMLNEITLNLIAPLEEAGYTLPESLVPDISEGRLFCDWLRKNRGVEPKEFPDYEHEYPDGRVVQARLYPTEYLEDFRRHFHEVWLNEKAAKYFGDRDTVALEFVSNLALPAPR
ncbi:hypothetical protein J4H27_01805 [Vibrio alginolyticus]|uniref:hypothetical protein n=1 Tax=Vibrio TaxID=662 RepID=UPI00193E1A59|nr:MULTISPECIES: hypothetical protein [Vibrio]MDW1808437.1 hypothetical protein [Vibrio sp. Vb2362]ELB2807297.1 hypothetical protein [Vibrio alginolyticus]ELB2845599.1 hypothetical protein [Vibrio alginolyticus]ELU8564974.1 hypothetical protein [Vibrio alginolyticus]MBM5038165.1 hypothetical protein [Vibrio parahaemolyticus]